MNIFIYGFIGIIRKFVRRYPLCTIHILGRLLLRFCSYILMLRKMVYFLVRITNIMAGCHLFHIAFPAGGSFLRDNLITYL